MSKNTFSLTESVLLEVLLNGPYSHFTAFGEDDFRDPNEKNPSLSISKKGWYDHQTQEGGSLQELTKSLGLSEGSEVTEEAGQKKVTANSKTILEEEIKSDTKKEPPITKKIWQNALSLDMRESNKEVTYLKNRCIQQIPEPWLAQIRRSKEGIIVPVLDVESTKRIHTLGTAEPEKISTIYVDDQSSKKGTRFKGNIQGAAMVVFPPVSGNIESEKMIAVEGLEDGLSFGSLSRFREYYIAVTCGKNQLPMLHEFAKALGIKDVTIVADHDADGGGLKKAEDAARIIRIKATEVECRILLPDEQGLDANKALQEQRLEEFWEKAQQITPSEEDTKGESKTKESPFICLGSLAWEKLAPKSDLIQKILPKNCLVLLSAKHSTFKSFLTMSMAVHLSAGLDWFGFKVKEKCSALMLLGEGEEGLPNRMRVLLDSMGNPEIDVHMINTTPNLADDDSVEELLKKIDQHIESVDRVPKLIVIDTLSTHFVHDGGQNNDQAMSKFLNGCKRIRNEYEATVLVVHHHGKDSERGSRGSYLLNCGVDLEYQLDRNKSTKQVTLKCLKNKEGALLDEVTFEFEPKKVIHQGTVLLDAYGEEVVSGIIKRVYSSKESKKSSESLEPKPKGARPQKEEIVLEAFHQLKNCNLHQPISSSELRALLRSGEYANHFKNNQRVGECFKADWFNKRFKIDDQDIISLIEDVDNEQGEEDEIEF